MYKYVVVPSFLVVCRMSIILPSPTVVSAKSYLIMQVSEEPLTSGSLNVQIARSKLPGSDSREPPGSTAKDGAEESSFVEKF